MSEYGKTFGRINNLQAEKDIINEKIRELSYKLYEIDVEIGECKGYIRELEAMDGEEY